MKFWYLPYNFIRSEIGYNKSSIAQSYNTYPHIPMVNSHKAMDNSMSFKGPIGPVKQMLERKIVIFSLSISLNMCLGAPKNCLICFGWDIKKKKIIFSYTLLSGVLRST